MTNIGDEFEDQLSEEFGLDRVTGSGNQWYSKLDLVGRGARWSLKATKKLSISIDTNTIDEAIKACGDIGGDGSIPIWAYRIGDNKHDLIVLRKEDFKLLQSGELNIINSGVKEQVSQRRARAKVPSLFRNEES